MDKIFYRGILIDKDTLPTMEEVVEVLGEDGGTDKDLAHIREKFEVQYDSELMIRVPVCDGSALGVVMLPVREGFLLLPYSNMDSEYYECFDTPRLMVPGEADMFLNRFKEYYSEVMAALADIEPILQPPAPTRYRDDEGNLYFVRAGMGGDTFKAFKWLAIRKKGQHQESGVRALPYVPDKNRAQRDLDEYAKKHGLVACPPLSDHT